MSNTGNIYGSYGNKSNPIDHIPLDITIMIKSLIVDFLPMDYKSPFNIIQGKYWTIPIESITSSKYQYIKFPHMGHIAKVHNNHVTP